MQTIDIDYIGVLDYLANNQEVPYSNPEAPGLAQDVKENLLKVKEKGQAVVAEMKKIAARCEELYSLDKCLPISWLDGSNTKTRKYLWIQIKYKDYLSNPTSISLFVEKNNGVTRYRISLEIVNDGIDKKTMNSYHSHLDIPKEEGMVYVSGSNEWGNPIVITETVEDIKKKIDSGEIRKVQLCIYVEPSAGKTNEQYDADVMDAVKRIIPYYEHVVGKTTKMAATGRAWLLTWNPINWDWADYKEWCADTKLGNKHIEPWTCSSSQPAVGDEIFLMKTGAKPRGILAHGYVSKEAYEAEHYDPEKAAQGVKLNHIDAEYDWIQDYNSEPVLMQDDLKDRLPDQQWSPMGSGIEIKSNVLPELEKMWLGLIGKKADEDTYMDLTTEEVLEITYDKNRILYGPPGTGKTYSTAIYAVAICDKLDIDIVKEMDYNEVMIRYRELLSAGRVAFTTFHQSYGYEEFIEGIKPVLNGDDIGYTIEDGVFKAFCIGATMPERAETDPNAVSSNKNYVFVIDEINRGNISKIFGELITLIEDTKREGMEEQASAVLPYSGKPFSVPSNVYMIGTMNTADRSIALMDTALRRRFQFIEMMPNADVLRDIGADKVEDLDVATMLEKINERITFLYDREHTIGHAFFTKLAKAPTIETLQSIFEKSVIPLLQEYFYEDYQKIQLVLGDNGKTDPSTKFILDEEIKVKNIFKGNADDVIDLPEKKYSINVNAFGNLESYKQII
ncbi:MAG: AAA domain-containing protein [Coprococcus sp.]|nr:AAA domain-containing protein [Coprococcus sp.]